MEKDNQHRTHSQHRTGRTGQPEHYWMIGFPGQGDQDRIVRTGLQTQGCYDKAARTEQKGKDNQNSSAITGWSECDSHNEYLNDVYVYNIVARRGGALGDGLARRFERWQVANMGGGTPLRGGGAGDS